MSERLEGIEPSCPGWQPGAQPMSDSRITSLQARGRIRTDLVLFTKQGLVPTRITGTSMFLRRRENRTLEDRFWRPVSAQHPAYVDCSFSKLSSRNEKSRDLLGSRLRSPLLRWTLGAGWVRIDEDALIRRLLRERGTALGTQIGGGQGGFARLSSLPF